MLLMGLVAVERLIREKGNAEFLSWVENLK